MPRGKDERAAASRILVDLPEDKAFYFFTDLGAYTGKRASNLAQFSQLLNEVDVRSVDFHVRRVDFENWLRFLGDRVSALQFAKLRKRGLSGESLRTKISALIPKRYAALMKMAQRVPSR